MTFTTLHRINKIFYFTTLGLYLLVYLGMIFQIVLGFVQLTIGVILLVRIQELSKAKKTKILTYWILVLIDLVLILINLKFGNDYGNLICFFLLPMAIATYFYFLTANINSNSFLTAEWNNLALINYEIDPKTLNKYLSIGTEIDFWNNKCYVSLVGFMFSNTKVLGMKFPFHINFEEVNLRFYVKRFENGNWKRGVVFIKEIVPKRTITFIANTLYNEHYQTNRMKHSVTENDVSKTFIYQWKNDNQWNSIQLETKLNPVEIELNSEAEFITEHYFGYTKYNENTTFEYEVTHPRWKQLELINYKIDVDFENNYGKDFAFLNDSKPVSVFLAKGSKITVENKKTLK